MLLSNTGENMDSYTAGGWFRESNFPRLLQRFNFILFAEVFQPGFFGGHAESLN
jgi:hypothetical protein